MVDLREHNKGISLGNKITGCRFIRNKKTGRIFVNNNNITWRDDLEPYFGKIDKWGFAVDSPEHLKMTEIELEKRIQQEELQRAASALEESKVKGETIIIGLNDGTRVKDKVSGGNTSPQHEEKLSESN